MQRKLTQQRRSDDETIKDHGLLVDLDEIARRGAMSAEEGLAAKWHGIYAARQPGNYMALYHAGMSEYALIIVLIAIFLILTQVFFKDHISNFFSNVGNQLT